ncbi:MAG: uvrD1 [Subtercola sp.]|nr:uvrD1 [Subtercola sp.]
MVDLADGLTVAVIGAPGSGKTRTLVELVADRVLGRGFRPSEIVALTPTRLAATRLRDRLALRLAVPTNGPMARTINSLAFQVVQAAAVASGAPAPSLLTGAEHDRIIAEMLAGHAAEGGGPQWPDPLTEDVRALRGFRTELRELMMRATEDGVSPHELSELGRLHGVPEWVAAGEFAAEYGEVVAGLADTHLDAAELIAAARLAVVRGELGVLTGVRMIVVDDFQELSAGAVNFLSTLARRGVAVVAFGDPDVATNTFRGGEKDGLGRLGSVLAVPAAEPLYLSTVYRHGPGIRSLVDRATTRIGAAAAGRQRAARSAASAPVAPARAASAGVASAPAASAPAASAPAEIAPVRRILATSSAGEIASIAHLLREHHLLRGVPWGDMAVVVRSGSLLSSMTRGLALAEVPTSTTTGGVALRDDYAARHLMMAVMLATGALELTDDRVSDLLLGPFGGLDGVSLRRLRLSLRQEELAGDGHRTAEELLRDALEYPGRLATIDSAPARRVARLAELLHRVRALEKRGASAEELLWLLFSGSRLGTVWAKQAQGSGILADEANRYLDGVVGVFTAAKRFVERTPSRPAGDFFVGLLEAEVAEDSLSPRSAGDAVVVSTPNGVIGAEFEVVVVARLQESVWPNLRLRGSLLHPDRLSAVVAAQPVADVDARAEVLGDELRMLVLAVSRATTQVVLTAVQNDDEQPSAFTRLVPDDGGTAGGAGDRRGSAQRDAAAAPAVTLAAARADSSGLVALFDFDDDGGVVEVTEVVRVAETGDVADPGVRHVEGSSPLESAPLGSQPLESQPLESQPLGSSQLGSVQRESPAQRSRASGASESSAAAAGDGISAPGFGRSAAGHPLSLRGLVGELRRRLAETGDPGAAAALARLAAEGVPGAHPKSWYGLREPSTLDDLVDLEDPQNYVDVSPSKLETFEKSPLAWFVDKVSGGTFGVPAGIGTLLHSVMEEVSKRTDPDLSVVALWNELDERWNELHFESPWLGERERRRTEKKVLGLSEYLQQFERNDATLLGGEQSFALDIGRARLRGTVDRVELHANGHVSVVDLKTGNSAPAAAAVRDHAQLGSYQLALAEGALVASTPTVDEAAAAGTPRWPAAAADPAVADPVAVGRTAAAGPAGPGNLVSDGAVLLYVALSSGSGANKVHYKLLAQAPLTDETEAEFRRRIETAAVGMAGSVFAGREGLDERDPHGRWNYRIHLVKAVSA